MHEPTSSLLNAYLDNELNQEQRLFVKRHITGCPTCKVEMEELRRISLLLQTAPMPNFLPPQQFIASLPLTLKRNPSEEYTERKKYQVWWLVPVGLLGLFFFFRTVFQVSTLITLADFTGMLGSASAWFGYEGNALWFTFLMNMTDGHLGAAWLSLVTINWLNMMGIHLLFSIFLQTGIFFLYAVWLVRWFKKNNRNMISYGLI